MESFKTKRLGNTLDKEFKPFQAEVESVGFDLTKCFVDTKVKTSNSKRLKRIKKLALVLVYTAHRESGSGSDSGVCVLGYKVRNHLGKLMSFSVDGGDQGDKEISLWVSTDGVISGTRSSLATLFAQHSHGVLGTPAGDLLLRQHIHEGNVECGKVSLITCSSKYGYNEFRSHLSCCCHMYQSNVSEHSVSAGLPMSEVTSLDKQARANINEAMQMLDSIAVQIKSVRKRLCYLHVPSNVDDKLESISEDIQYLLEKHCDRDASDQDV